jgi:hypothetical protein
MFTCLALGCPKSVPMEQQPHAVTPDAGLTPELVLAGKVDAIDLEAERVMYAVDAALWTQWTSGAPLDLAKAATGHDALFSKATLETLRTAQAQHVEAVRARHLELWLLGNLLAHGITAETEALASLEAGASFQLDGREVAWRELPKLLVTEKSAVKRRALWAASQPVVERLDALFAVRDEKAKEVLAAYDVPSPLELDAQTREVNAEALAAVARTVLTQTDEAWKASLKRLSDAELKLPLDALTRADLPRLLKVPAPVDAAFPKGIEAKLAVDTVFELGLAGAPGLTLELTEGSKKKPLPLTVVPAKGDVRVSFRPAGGLRDVTQALGEVGTALALHQAKTGHASTDRLGDPARAMVLAELLSSLVAEPAWLSARGVPAEQHAAIIATAQVNRLFVARRACLGVLLQVETAGLSEADAHARAAELIGHAYAVKTTALDGLRLPLDLDDGLRAGTTLKSMLVAAQRRATLPEQWWSGQGAKALLAEWSDGTRRSLEDGANPAALVAWLGGAVPVLPKPDPAVQTP